MIRFNTEDLDHDERVIRWKRKWFMKTKWSNEKTNWFKRKSNVRIKPITI